jgi:thioredoxin reductase
MERGVTTTRTRRHESCNARAVGTGLAEECGRSFADDESTCDSMTDRASYEVVIAGGGPAGLSAALVLGRCCRRVLLCDGGRPRNVNASKVHGFFTRDGVAPHELRRIGREQLATYRNVSLLDLVVCDAKREASGFSISLSDGSQVFASKLLLTSGLVDVLPPIAGLPELWGKGVFPCPYCDGWEVRRQRLAVYGRGSKGLSLCRALTGWSHDVHLFSDGPCELSPAERRGLLQRHILIHEERVVRLEAREQRLEAIVLENGSSVERDALFISAPQQQQSPLAEKLGCSLERGVVQTDEWQSTDVAGLYVAGDASRDVQLAIVAAAEGARAAFDINRALVRDAFENPGTGASAADAVSENAS